MWYCPGSDMIILSALGVTLVCHTSSVFLVLKPPLSIIEVFSKWIGWSRDQAWFAIFEPLVAVLTFVKCSFSDDESSARFSNVAPQTIGTRKFGTRLLSSNPVKVETSGLGTVVAGWSMVCLKMLSDVFGGLVSKVRLHLPCNVYGQVQLERVKFLNVQNVRPWNIVVGLVKKGTGQTTKCYAPQFRTCQTKQTRSWTIVIVPLLVFWHHNSMPQK